MSTILKISLEAYKRDFTLNYQTVAAEVKNIVNAPSGGAFLGVQVEGAFYFDNEVFGWCKARDSKGYYYYWLFDSNAIPHLAIIQYTKELNEITVHQVMNGEEETPELNELADFFFSSFLREAKKEVKKISVWEEAIQYRTEEVLKSNHFSKRVVDQKANIWKLYQVKARKKPTINLNK